MALFDSNTMINPLISIVEKQLTEEKTLEMFTGFISQFTVEPDEDRNIIILTEAAGKIYFAVVGIKGETITRRKYQVTLAKGISLLLTAGKQLKKQNK